MGIWGFLFQLIKKPDIQFYILYIYATANSLSKNTHPPQERKYKE